MSTSTERKQNYLYDEIIGQGFDAEVFMNYMAEAKEDGTNIERWTMAELVNIVSEFKDKYSNSQLQQENNNANDYNSQVHQPQQNYDTNNPYGYDNQYSAAASTINHEKPQVHEEPQFEKKQSDNKQTDLKFGGFQQDFNQQSLNQQNIQQQSSVNMQTSQNYSFQQSQVQAKQNQQEAAIKPNTGSQNIKNNEINQQPQQPLNDMNASKNKPQFSETIQFDPGLSSLIKASDPFQNFNSSQKSNMPTQNFENSHIWSNPLGNNIQSSNNNWTATSQSDPFAMISTGKTQDPFAMVNQGNNQDPFAMFQSTTNTVSSQNQSDKNDPFSSFYQPQTAQKQQQQPQKIPSQPPAPVHQNPQTQKTNDIDIEDFLFGGIGSNNKAQKPNPQINVQTAVAAPVVAAVGVKAINNNISNNNSNIQQVQDQSKNKQAAQQVSSAAQKQPQKQTNQNQDLTSQIKEPVPNSNKNSEEKYKTEKACKKSVQTVVGVKPEVVVSIVEHEIVQGSLFSIGGSNLAIYHVKTMPFNWTVKRKQNDFIWLRNILIKMYPGIPIPPLPGKTMKSLDDKLVQRRKGYFESFLYEILSQPDLKSSKFITDFLSIGDDKIFKQRIKETEKCNRPKNLNEIETTSGKIYLNKNPECNNHSQIISEYFTENDQCYEKLKKLSKQLMDAYGHVGGILHQMGDTFAQLHTNVVTYDQKAMQSSQIKELEETYKIMNNMCVMQANSFSDQIKIFQNHFYNFFKFHKDNLTGLKEVVKTRNELNQILAKKDSNESSFSNIFRSSKEAVYHPSKILKELDEQVGYYNEMMLLGTRKILHNRANTYSKHFMTYCNLQKSIVAEMGTVWQDISDHFNNVLKNEIGKKKIEIMKKVN
ncbi:PX-SNX-like domain protein (macronuclear) [Tetrahymena thermophila SB210]|uniref:PX-SNX-like domain protein n=1 Tax=Tetrahymena thermophila (strain SB210) TaxID=312017 RepID=I7M2V3_TETTS|nr:PX-SNX-like domain protein [Tetrahymena thermophila SB210]EAS01365.2 PX-SNX-like domain protein [Tetrahymena thermophila SB210]|eukprot:XP_001021611.2 PX-SNX-like domain protein [Tetrahymena thermophila SB210]